MVDIILHKVTDNFTEILGDRLVGIYVHGSIAFGCFRFETSDIDFIAVVKNEPTLEQKVKLIRFILDITPEAPVKGIEMSVVLLEYCRNFIYPTPYTLHYSSDHKERYEKDLEGVCKDFHGLDTDLAAHFTVIHKVGFVLCGDEIPEVFGEVPWDSYMDSICRDVTDAETDILTNPLYIILNLCRVFAAAKNRLVLSKEQGGLWALKNAPCYAPLIREALDCYASGGKMSVEETLLKNFVSYIKYSVNNCIKNSS